MGSVRCEVVGGKPLRSVEADEASTEAVDGWGRGEKERERGRRRMLALANALCTCAHASTRGERQGEGRTTATRRHPMTRHTAQEPRVSPRIIGTCCLSRTWPTLEFRNWANPTSPILPSLPPPPLLISSISPMLSASPATAGLVLTPVSPIMARGLPWSDVLTARPTLYQLYLPSPSATLAFISRTGDSPLRAYI